MRLLVLGAGGIGGYFGGRLAASGADVTFLVRPARRAQLERDGLRIRSPRGDLSMRVRTIVASEVASDYDAVLLTCKAYDLESALDAIAPAMSDRCVVLPLLNGMAHLERLDARFGAAQVMGGTCSIGVALDTDGVIQHSGALHRIAFGERDQKRTVRAEMLAHAFSATAVEWELAADIVLNMWEKLCMLSVLAASNCLFRANMGEIVSAPGGLDAVERALAVNFEIASRDGHAPRPAAMEFARQTLTEPGNTRSGSMLHDLERGAPVESEHIIGWMLARARAHELDATLLSFGYTHLSAYQNRRDTTLRSS